MNVQWGKNYIFMNVQRCKAIVSSNYSDTFFVIV